MPGSGQIHSGGSVDTGPTAIAVTKPSSVDRFTAEAARPCSEESDLSSSCIFTQQDRKWIKTTTSIEKR
jgi:hypothetical protein